MIFEVAHWMGAVPLLWLALLHSRGKSRDAAWWWLAGAFFVSWLADTAAHYWNPWVGSQLYPVLQSAIVAMVFLSRRDASIFIVTLGIVGFLDLVLFGISDWNVLLRTTAWGGIVVIVWQLPQLRRLRASLLVYFGLGLLVWCTYAIDPAWWSWLGYQGVRLLGILWFCWAATSPLPQLRLTRA